MLLFLATKHITIYLYTQFLKHMLITEGLLTFSPPYREYRGRKHVTRPQTTIHEIINL